MLLGRASETEAIDALLKAARDGSSRTLVLAGEPGIGKSALLQYARESADDLQVASLAGVESELNLDFAGLHRFLLPFLEMREQLPEPQRDALGGAFGLVAAAPADRFLVGLAALTLLADAANDRPVLCIVDDAQWVDQESIEVLAFVARRLHAERIALLCATRSTKLGPDPLAGFERVTLHGLDDADAGELLARSARSEITPSVARLILDETGGNPLALVELGRELSAEQAAGAFVLSPSLPVGERLEACFIEQARILPDDAQTLLLIGAAETSGDGAAVRRAALTLGIPADAHDSVESGDLMTLGPRVEFRHPLVRSAVYAAAAPADRRRIHRALADATDREQYPERRALHLAAAAVDPDEEVAVELERSARRARSRGGYAAEASLLTRAAELSPDAASRAARLLDASQAALSGGDPHRAQALLDLASPDVQTPLGRATAQRLDGLLQAPLGQPALGPAILLEAARAFIPIDGAVARATFLEALEMYLIAHSFTEGTTGAEVARAALDFLDGDADGVGTEHILLEAVATLIGSGYVASVPALRRVADALRDTEIRGDDLLKWSSIGRLVENELLDDEGWRVASARLEAVARDNGALGTLQTALLGAATLDTLAGRFGRARERHTEALELTALMGGYVKFYALLDVDLLAWSGDDQATRSKARLLQQQGAAAGSHATVYMAWLALAVLDLGEGNYREAFDAAHRVTADDIPVYSCRALPYVIEAGTRCGEAAAAREALARLEERAVTSGAPSALGLFARSQALLADDDQAESLYQRAVDLLATTHWKTELARAHLVYGEWLRRTNRRLDAREQLRTAHDMFADMGAQAFAERARIELAATGERARKRTVDTADELTPQEAQVARLAAERVTSREIAAQLFISSKTVEYHLGKVFRKLGVSSRRDLAAALTPETVG